MLQKGIEITNSNVGIEYSGYLAERNLDISSIVIMSEEQIYLPFASGYSRRKICALATSSMCTIDVLMSNSYCS